MAIIISKNGRDARKVEQAQVGQEDYLQRYVSDNPDSLPLDEEIVIPKLFGAEVKKEVSPSGGGRRKRLGSEDEFFEKVQDEAAKAAFRKLLKFGDSLGAVRSLGSSAISVKVPDPKGSRQNVTLFVMGTYGEVYIGWTIQQLEALGLPRKIALEYAASLAALYPGVTPDAKYPDSLSRELTAEEVERSFQQFTATVAHFVEKLRKASAGQYEGGLS